MASALEVRGGFFCSNSRTSVDTEGAAAISWTWLLDGQVQGIFHENH